MAYNRIILKQPHGPNRVNAIASGTPTPGHILEFTNAAADTLKVHSTASGNVIPVIVAVEDDLQGNGITTAYTAATQLQAEVLLSGDIFNALIADGQNVAKGDLLESAGTGRLQKYVADSTGVYYPGQIVGVAMEACDMSGSAGVDPSGRCAVMVR